MSPKLHIHQPGVKLPRQVGLCFQLSFTFQQRRLTVCCTNAGVKMKAVPHRLQERFQSIFWSLWCPTIVSKHWSAVCLLDIEVSSSHQWQCTTSCPFQSRSNASKHKVRRSSIDVLHIQANFEFKTYNFQWNLATCCTNVAQKWRLFIIIADISSKQDLSL